MDSKRRCSTALSCVLALALLVSTSPVSAGVLARPVPMLGTISVVGNVQLRGISLTREGTIFSGDQIRTADQGYARIALRNGDRFEASGTSNFTVQQETNGVHVGLTSGNLGFVASSPLLAFSVGRYEIVPKAGTSGGIGFLAPETVAINVLSGSVVLRESGTRQSMVIAPGGQYAIKLKTNGPIAELVSVIPASVPSAAAAPQPTPGQPAGQANPSGGWFSKKVALLIAGAAAATTTILLATGGDDEPECGATCLAEKAQAQQVARLTLQTAQQTQAAIAAILASNPIANTQNSVISSLITQLNALQQQLQNSNLTPSQVSALVATARNLEAQMNAVLAALLNANLPGNITIPGKVPSSLSLPE